MSNNSKNIIPSPYAYKMFNNRGSNQQHSFNWFMEQEKNSTHGGNKPQQVSVVQFPHRGPPSAITGTDISKGLTDKFLNAKNDAKNDGFVKETTSGGKKSTKSRKIKKSRKIRKSRKMKKSRKIKKSKKIKKSRKMRKSRKMKKGGYWQTYRVPGDPPTKVRFRWIDEYDTPSEDEE